MPKAANLAADGQLAHSTGQPVVILFSRTPCGWCDKARREHLDAMATQAAAQPGSALFRQIDLDSDAPLIDFSGQRTRHRDFARKHSVTMTPTLLFLAADGRDLAAPIVGYRLAEFYGTLIEDAIEDSRDRLRSNAK
ncbi:MAG: thioredoxin fold domain-containing protein [Gammaproteobacteria bacterium]|nr:thioredoxin fold domain-containing protein [Gammaproteobacteria bacterium]MBU1415123.1 thioredoxin fold domain-containing protein [Gammaproteobacteria bacterium]